MAKPNKKPNRVKPDWVFYTGCDVTDKFVFPPKKAHGRITMNVTNTPDIGNNSKLCATLVRCVIFNIIYGEILDFRHLYRSITI